MAPEGYILRRFYALFSGVSKSLKRFVFGLFTDKRAPVSLKIATETHQNGLYNLVVNARNGRRDI